MQQTKSQTTAKPQKESQHITITYIHQLPSPTKTQKNPETLSLQALPLTNRKHCQLGGATVCRGVHPNEFSTPKGLVSHQVGSNHHVKVFLRSSYFVPDVHCGPSTLKAKGVALFPFLLVALADPMREPVGLRLRLWMRMWRPMGVQQTRRSMLLAVHRSQSDSPQLVPRTFTLGVLDFRPSLPTHLDPG